jgi:hypothetical protein
MNKLLTILVMAMFLVSLAPIALAEDDGATVAGSTEGTQEKYQIDAKAREDFLSQAQQKRQDLLEKRDMAREGMTGEQIEIATKHEGLKRKFAGDREALAVFLEQNRAERANARANYQEAKTKLADSKNKLKDCKGKADDAACAETKKQAKKDAKDFLLNSADRVLALLEKTKERITNSDMADAGKTASLAKIDARIAELAGARTTIEQLGDDVTKDQIQEASRLIKDAWKGTNKDVKEEASKLAASKIGGVLVQIERLQAKLQNKIDQLKKAGKDTSAIDAIMTDFNAKIDAAKASQADAQTKFAEGNAKEGTTAMKAAHKSIKEARILLKDAVRKIAKVAKGEKAKAGLETETAQEQAAEQAQDAAAEATETATE